jgi:hypothetical protein
MDKEAYEATQEALHWVRVSFLQIDRYVGSFLTHAEAKSADDQVTADAAPTRTIADAHFLLNACAQAEKALRRTGRPLPPAQKTTIRSLRNVHEHWEQHRESFESKKNTKTRAGRHFDEAHPGQLPWTFKYDATGTWISALRLEDLWEELAAVELDLCEAISSFHAAHGLPPQPAGPARGSLVRRESRVPAMSMITQNVVIDFDE